MPWDLPKFFKGKGAKVYQTPGFGGSDAENEIGLALEKPLRNKLENAHPEIGKIVNTWGARDPEVWERVKALAREGDVTAQQLVDLEGKSDDFSLSDDPPISAGEGVSEAGCSECYVTHWPSDCPNK